MSLLHEETRAQLERVIVRQRKSRAEALRNARWGRDATKLPARMVNITDPKEREILMANIARADRQEQRGTRPGTVGQELAAHPTVQSGALEAALQMTMGTPAAGDEVQVDDSGELSLEVEGEGI